ncbi:hypothetical protein AOQ84DRAFT_358641, partial [Glonium stellatum]
TQRPTPRISAQKERKKRKKRTQQPSSATSPADVSNSIFFQNPNGIVPAAQPHRSWLRAKSADWHVAPSLLVVFRELDNQPVFWDLGGVAGGAWWLAGAARAGVCGRGRRGGAGVGCGCFAGCVLWD